MKTKYLSIIFILIFAVFVIPQIALAAWWNPFSWSILNNIFNKQTTVVQSGQSQAQKDCAALAKQTFDTMNPVLNQFNTFNYKIYYNNGNCYLLTDGLGDRQTQNLLMSVSKDPLKSKWIAICETYSVTPSGNLCQYWVPTSTPAEKYDINKFNNFIKSYQVGLVGTGNAGDLSQAVNDSNIRGNLNNIGGEAMVLFKETGSYASLCANGGLNASLSLNNDNNATGKYFVKVSDLIMTSGGKKPICFSNTNDFCISTQVADGSWICINKNIVPNNIHNPGTTECESPTTTCK
jgi:hypothetical protein